jgi:hypothetical protein
VVNEDDFTVSFPVKVLREVFPSMGKSKTLYERVRDKRHELTGFKVDLVNDNSFKTWVLITYAEYTGGTFTIKFNPQMREHLTGMKRDFLAYKLMYIAELETAHDQHLYEILRSYLFAGKWKVSYEDLRRRLGLDRVNRYQQIGNFRKDILAGFVARANEKTDINITVEDIKEGRRIWGFMFHLAANDRHRALEQQLSEPQMRILEELKSYGVKSFTGWLLSAIRDGYDTLSPDQKVALEKRRRIDEMMALYEAAEEPVRDIVLNEFRRTIAGSAVQTFYEDEGMKHQLVRGTMAGFIRSAGPRFGLPVPTSP